MLFRLILPKIDLRFVRVDEVDPNFDDDGDKSGVDLPDEGKACESFLVGVDGAEGMLGAGSGVVLLSSGFDTVAPLTLGASTLAAGVVATSAGVTALGSLPTSVAGVCLIASGTSGRGAAGSVD